MQIKFHSILIYQNIRKILHAVGTYENLDLSKHFNMLLYSENLIKITEIIFYLLSKIHFYIDSEKFEPNFQIWKLHLITRVFINVAYSCCFIKIIFSQESDMNLTTLPLKYPPLM